MIIAPLQYGGAFSGRERLNASMSGSLKRLTWPLTPNPTSSGPLLAVTGPPLWKNIGTMFRGDSIPTPVMLQKCAGHIDMRCIKCKS
ncbi:hypothetical protein DPMN_179524 [Dreissena polymorpha]|uniref:Uncharacterized protein n=1 Tax=Dreissena polymorpha TaxID=45954 RepID=A0A9D4IJM9_DREPO|nr:hypothetical protein DPMN_179524 [Dreissena polymorpha]